MPTNDEINKEILQLRNENEILQQKNAVLEDSVRGALQEITLLNVDINVLKTKIKELERGTNTGSMDVDKASKVLQDRLDFKIQEADDLRKRLNENETMIIELEKKIQDIEKVRQELKKKEQELASLTKIIESLQAENAELKKKI